MFHTVAFKTCQRVLFAATALSLVSSTAFVIVAPSHSNRHDRETLLTKKQEQTLASGSGQLKQSPLLIQQHKSRYRSWSSLIASPVVRCQAAATASIPWEVEESDTYHYEKMDLPSRAIEISHVIFGQLLQNGSIERYDVYKRVNDRIGEESPEIVVADIQLGHKLDGHEGIVHGGVLAMLFDDAMGMAFGAMGVTMAYTANLSVDYRIPVEADSKVLIRVRLSRREGRKLYFTAQMTSHDASILYAEATTLYIIPRHAFVEDAASQ